MGCCKSPNLGVPTPLALDRLLAGQVSALCTNCGCQKESCAQFCIICGQACFPSSSSRQGGASAWPSSLLPATQKLHLNVVRRIPWFPVLQKWRIGGIDKDGERQIGRQSVHRWWDVRGFPQIIVPMTIDSVVFSLMKVNPPC